MITKNPYNFGYATKPGHLPEPRKPIYNPEPQERIDICLDCPIASGCKPKSAACPLRKKRKTPSEKDIEMQERKSRIIELLNAGWKDKDIRDELHISETTYFRVKKKLRDLGEIT